MRGIIAVALSLACSTMTPSAFAASPHADKHDRAQIAQLVSAYRTLVTIERATSSLSEKAVIEAQLHNCSRLDATLHANPGAALTVILPLVIARAIDIVHQAAPQVHIARLPIARLTPHASVFKAWQRQANAVMAAAHELATLGDGKVDYCAAAQALLHNDQVAFSAAIGLSRGDLERLQRSSAAPLSTDDCTTHSQRSLFRTTCRRKSPMRSPADPARF